MSNDTPKKRVVSIIGYVLAVFVFVIDKWTSTIFSFTLKEAFVICGITIVIGFLCWLLVFLLLKKVLINWEEGQKVGLSNVKAKADTVVNCTRNESMLCSLCVGINEYGLDYQNDEPISEGDRLYKKDYVYEIEEKGRNNEKWIDIWIFSEDLLSEIDLKKNKAESVVIDNVINNKTTYTFFYLNSKDNENVVQDNREILESSILEPNRLFVPIDVDNGYIGNHTLPLLCGSILFSKKKRNNMPDFVEGYLSIRKDIKDNPIYYKMPKCMLREYANYFKEIYNNYKNKGE